MLPTATLERPIHICLADPKYDQRERFENACLSGEEKFDWWNITKYAEPGDKVVFYMTAPVSAFIATGTVGSKADDVPEKERSQFYRSHCYWINHLEMLPRDLTLAEMKRRFPKWGFLKRPGVTTIPNATTSTDVVADFIRLMLIALRPTIKPPDVVEPPPRIRVESYRVLRDTAMARAVKLKHGCRCQICGLTIRLPDGSYYAEAHHIRPLGGDHYGPDDSANILCLCPNHHAELDYGVRRVSLDKLRCVEGHCVGEQFLDYHNTKVFNRGARR